MSTYPSAQAKIQKWIFPGNWFKFGIILDDFSSSKIRAIQIQVQYSEFRNPENPGIHYNHFVYKIICFINRNVDW